MKHKLHLTTIALILICNIAHCQVKDIKKHITEDNNTELRTNTPNIDKKTSKSDKFITNNYETNNFDDNDNTEIPFIFEAAYYMVTGIGYITVAAQSEILKQKNKYPNIISFEAKSDYATDMHSLMFTPSASLNWGIFATDFRYNLLQDNTGKLSSLDWQIIKLRVPVKYFSLHYGIGYTYIHEPKAKYFESTTGFNTYFLKNKLNLNMDYRWTEKKGKRKYRQELKFAADFLTIHNKHFFLYSSIGYTYQLYFNHDKYKLFDIGLKLKFSNL